MATDHEEEPDAGTAKPVPGGAPAPGRRTRRPLDPATRARIGRGLRLHYAEVLALPVPDRLRTLLDDLAARSDRESP